MSVGSAGSVESIPRAMTTDRKKSFTSATPSPGGYIHKHFWLIPEFVTVSINQGPDCYFAVRALGQRRHIPYSLL